ncbi:Crp/Fnr family transcriptional regulator [Saccharothrix coeruleofusca]|uniref:CRP-like cAMP-binding protein n=1 Tax=Saccharothrix coeruleofusca TaxID=33919 RepID=A0A918AM71_9PSEU|nr:Crp/Fnr family transcriptional regulator [Saccharothrix coeruleofusca]GGP51644.1 hypothetical protein GCM10010185_24590 [Saccharothrix coeruleofusca]GGP84966.1 hypothetical protein GCM10010185_68510 [Saccharothrix coeruleofusca]
MEPRCLQQQPGREDRDGGFLMHLLPGSRGTTASLTLESYPQNSLRCGDMHVVGRLDHLESFTPDPTDDGTLPGVPLPRVAPERLAGCAPAQRPTRTPAGRLAERLRATGLPTPTLRLPQHDSLYNCGEPGDALYTIESGCVKTMTYSAVGKFCLLDIHTAGDLIGESCLLGRGRTETATAMLPTVLRTVRRDHFVDSLSDGSLRAEVLRYLADRIAQQQKTISLFVTLDSERRLAATLLRLGRKLGVRRGELLLLPHRITHEELGGLVGTTRSRVGYFLKRFRDIRLVEATGPWPLAVHERRIADYVEDPDL